MKKSVIAFVGGLLLLPLVGIAAAWLGLWPSRATSAPIAMGNGICRKDPATALAAMGNSAILSDVEIWQVVTFLNNLQSLPEPVAAEWKTKR
jgi:hypothetical protein